MKCPDCPLIMRLDDINTIINYRTPYEGTTEYSYRCTCGATVTIIGKYEKEEVKP